MKFPLMHPNATEWTAEQLKALREAPSLKAAPALTGRTYAACQRKATQQGYRYGRNAR